MLLRAGADAPTGAVLGADGHVDEVRRGRSRDGLAAIGAELREDEHRPGRAEGSLGDHGSAPASWPGPWVTRGPRTSTLTPWPPPWAAALVGAATAPSASRHPMAQARTKLRSHVFLMERPSSGLGLLPLVWIRSRSGSGVTSGCSHLLGGRPPNRPWLIRACHLWTIATTAVRTSTVSSSPNPTIRACSAAAALASPASSAAGAAWRADRTRPPRGRRRSRPRRSRPRRNRSSTTSRCRARGSPGDPKSGPARDVVAPGEPDRLPGPGGAAMSGARLAIRGVRTSCPKLAPCPAAPTSMCGARPRVTSSS